MQEFIKILEDNYKTVVKKYEYKPKEERTYQSEAELEKWFIDTLISQGYEYLNIHDNKSLKDNLRLQLEKLNDFKFDDEDWENFYKTEIANEKFDIKKKTFIIQKDYIKSLIISRTGQTKNIKLIDKEYITRNFLQVIHQVKQEGNAKNRYDVTILVNGFPLVHIELKKRGKNIKEAFNQIQRYQRESFWAGDGLFEYVQIYVISNGTYTLYYSNSTRYNIEKDNETFNPIKKSITSNSFEFTITWADQENNHINDLEDFTYTFLATRTLLNILTKYCVFTADEELIVMRPYQIAATENIIYKIKMANNNHWQGSKKAGGYIWHTTGSGKTLTSFKTAQIVSNLDFIDKVIFIVDRKDLYYQTIKEYKKLEKDSFDQTKNSAELKKKIDNNNSKILVTTIQKMSRLLHAYNDKNNKLNIFDKNVVFIFDECHRSQFGLMHRDIITNFKKYFLFGFTGTPIFIKNSNRNNKILSNNKQIMIEKTTEELFGDRLHTYTIKQALIDKKVLPFNVQYWNTFNIKDNQKEINEAKVNLEEILLDDKRIKQNVEHVLKHFNQITKHGSIYDLKLFNNTKKENKISIEKRDGFNSIFTCSSIKGLRKYYQEFRRQIANSSDEKIKSLKIATIFSYSINQGEDSNGDIKEEVVDEFQWDYLLDQDFLKETIKDYERNFNTKINTSSPDWFYNYCQYIAEKTKNKEIDILLVVNMFLTGFDAPTLNTLWVDRNLEMHGLIQAFSRTNRILKQTKDAGNIVCFRNLQEQVEDAIKTFSNENESGLVLLRTFKEYYEGYIENDKRIKGYKEVVTNFINDYPINDSENLKSYIDPIKIKEFISRFNDILRRQSILIYFEEFNEEKAIITDPHKQKYLDIYQDFKGKIEQKIRNEKTSVYDDVVFEMELINEQTYNVPEIIALMKEYQLEKKEETKLLVEDLKIKINAATFNKFQKELLLKFLNESYDSSKNNFDEQFKEYVDHEFEKDLSNIVNKFNLNKNETHKFILLQLVEQEFNPLGEITNRFLPRINRFDKSNNYSNLKYNVLLELKELFDKYVSIYPNK